MSQAYTQELRVDTSRIVIPLLSVGAMLITLAYALLAESFLDAWHFWFALFLAPIGGWLALNFIKQDRNSLGTTIFFFAQYSIVTILLFQEWRPGSTIPYLFGILIVASSMLNRVESGFFAWIIATVLLLLAAFTFNGVTFQALPPFIGPIIINLSLAIVAYLSAMEWQFAVETVSDLHLNAQRRRDELYSIQEKVKWANAKLESSNKQLAVATQAALDERDIRTRFMNHVSHELRTPLNSIVNFAHIIRLGGRGPVSEGQIDYLDRIEKSGWHLLSVLNDLLDMAQIQAGEFNLHLEVCELKPICEEAMTSTRGLLLDTPLDLVRDYPEVWPHVYVDRMRIKQALINLLGNAVKYTEAGTITLRVEMAGADVHLIIEDTGIGISAEHFENIFLEFRQINESDARRRVGTGLGLPITKHLIERHGGTITIESEVGKGSAFTLILPTVDPDFKAPAPNEVISAKQLEWEETRESVVTA